MNKQRLQILIDVMQDVVDNERPFQISGNWQSVKIKGRYYPAHWGARLAYSAPQLHACGNAACVAGHLAVSLQFKALGGDITYCGAPVFAGRISSSETGKWAMANFLGSSVELASDICGMGTHNTSTPCKFYGVKDLRRLTAKCVVERLRKLYKDEFGEAAK